MDQGLVMAMDKLKANQDTEKFSKKLPEIIKMKTDDGGFMIIDEKEINIMPPMKVAKSHMKNYGKDKTVRTFELQHFDESNWKEWGDALAFHAQAVMSGDDPDNHSLKLSFPDDDWDD